jgi:hypothetical protein
VIQETGIILNLCIIKTPVSPVPADHPLKKRHFEAFLKHPPQNNWNLTPITLKHPPQNNWNLTPINLKTIGI